jgi:IS605 OrfB family transposase
VNIARPCLATNTERMTRENAGSTIAVLVVLSHRPNMLLGMQLRYRYRLEPTAEQRRALARAFGSARVVWNDALRIREEAFAAGRPFVTDGELMRLVTTQAKRTSERAWLSEVSAVVLQQSVVDLHRAYRAYFQAVKDLKAERAKGNTTARLRVGRPRFKTKRHQQAVRFTANSRFLVLPNGRLRLSKVGDLRVRWSRPLPADPSSVTVVLDSSGRYHASFVVRVAEVPLSPAKQEVGIDLGLTSFAALSTGERIANPRWLRQREQALRRSHRSVSRKRQGSKNWERARGRLARQHRKVADTRRDFHHQLSTKLIRESQAVHVETLNIAGLGQSNWAKSVKDAGWSSFVAMLEYKAQLYGRTLVRIDQWHPSSQLCFACGARTGPRGRDGLKVRVWTCPECGVTHDRDVNAARNILAAGRAVAACGGGVSPGVSLAVAGEAGTTPDLAG